MAPKDRIPERFTAAAIANACAPLGRFHVIAWSGSHWLLLARDVDEHQAQDVIAWYNARPAAAETVGVGL